MKTKRLVLTAILLSSIGVHLGQLHRVVAASKQAIVFSNVRVIDVANGVVRPPMTVVVSDDRIAASGTPETIAVPDGARVVDGRGKFLMPGLWDMHAHPHLNSRFMFPLFALNLYIANGVTGLRDTFGPLEVQRQWLKAMDVGVIVGPRMFLSGPIVDGPKPAFAGSIAVGNETEARNAVAALKARGADFIKVYDLLPRDAYFAIADEAKKQGIPFAGHVPARITASEASDAGQKSIEHLGDVAVSCSTEQARLQQELTEGLLNEDNSKAIRALTVVETRALETYDHEKALALAKRFVKNRTWQDPTLVALRVNAYIGDDAFRNDPRLRYIPQSLRDEWDPANGEYSSALNAEEIAEARRAFPVFLRLVGDLHRAGVRFLTGTDAPAVPFCFPGFSIHDEMFLFVQAGMTPMEALQASTINPAVYLGIENEYGTIETGKMADMVLLDANPLDDIRNTTSVRAVVVRGVLLDRDALDLMLSQVERASRRL